jgi:hypothetical protein
MEAAMRVWFFSISHWGMVRIVPDEHESYWEHIWWMNADARGTWSEGLG